MNTITIDTGDAVEKALGEKNKYEPYNNLVPETNPILKNKVSRFVFDGKNDPLEISGRLKETLKANKAYGVAAPQCGLDLSVFCMGFEDFFLTMFNPEIIHKSKETVHLMEGCLSFPFLLLNITRSKTIKVKFEDEKGEAKEITLDGISARVAQHEIDHLNGITFDTLAKPMALKSGNKKREKYTKKFVRNWVLNKNSA
jgi:peptide deformylase